MLWSEVQVFDVTVLAAKAAGPAIDRDCYELIYCAEGSVSFAMFTGVTVRLLTGQCLITIPSEDAMTMTAGGHGATVLRVRALPVTTSRKLPARRPGLDEKEPSP